METKQTALRKVADSILGSSPLDYGFSFADALIYNQKKQPICFCILMQDTELENCIKIQYGRLASWDIMMKAFGPIPLAIVKYGNGVEAKRVSLSWQDEYAAIEGSDVNIPNTGFVKLK